jgi:hypothetical protein
MSRRLDVGRMRRHRQREEVAIARRATRDADAAITDALLQRYGLVDSWVTDERMCGGVLYPPAGDSGVGWLPSDGAELTGVVETEWVEGRAETGWVDRYAFDPLGLGEGARLGPRVRAVPPTGPDEDLRSTT